VAAGGWQGLGAGDAGRRLGGRLALALPRRARRGCCSQAQGRQVGVTAPSAATPRALPPGQCVPHDRGGASFLRPLRAGAGHRRRQRKVTVIDFENLPPLAEDTFKLATRREQICVKTQAVKDTLLPMDLHFEVRSLTGGPLQPLSSAHHSVSLWDMPSAGTLQSEGPAIRGLGGVRPMHMRMFVAALVRLRCDAGDVAIPQAKQLAELFLKPGVRVTRSMTRAARAGTAGASTDDMGYASSDDGGGDFGAHNAWRHASQQA
jgi:hypothetical protein